MKPTQQDLFLIIGQQQVELLMLRAEVARLSQRLNSLVNQPAVEAQ